MGQMEQAPKIVAYLKPVCGWSNGVRAVLSKYGLEYEDKDIINNPRNYQEMVMKSRQYLSPCVEINGIMLADISGDEVEAYLLEKEHVKPIDAKADVATDRGCADHSEPVTFPGHMSKK